MEYIFQTSHIIDVTGLVRSYDLETCDLKKYCEKFKAKKRYGILR